MTFKDIAEQKELRNALLGALTMVFISFLSFQTGKAIGTRNPPHSAAPACVQSLASPEHPPLNADAGEPK